MHKKQTILMQEKKGKEKSIEIPQSMKLRSTWIACNRCRCLLSVLFAAGAVPNVTFDCLASIFKHF